MELRALKAALSKALRWEPLGANSFQSIKPLAITSVPPAFLSRKDFQTLLDSISEGWLRELIVFGVATGVRQGLILSGESFTSIQPLRSVRKTADGGQSL